VKLVARVYLKAIETSVKAAEHGFTFASKAIRLCERLSRDPNTNIRQSIKEMRQIARQAHRDVNDTSKKFSAIRRTLIQVITCGIASDSGVQQIGKRVGSHAAQIEAGQDRDTFGPTQIHKSGTCQSFHRHS
jgi:hypothetical protein